MNKTSLHDSLCRATWTSRPGSFVSLMTLYESNYIRLRQLLGNLQHLPDRQVARLTGDCTLHVDVEERCRYTTTFTLTYQFVEADQVISDPDLQVRVYHDARLGEALHCARWRNPPVVAATCVGAVSGQQRDLRLHESARQLDDRWQRNIMLNKWLDYCVDRGYSFGAR